MSPDERARLVNDNALDSFDRQLGPERGPGGEPTATDFLVMDLPAVVERFSTRLDELPEAVAGVPAVRMFIGASALASAFVVHGVGLPRGSRDSGS